MRAYLLSYLTFCATEREFNSLFEPYGKEAIMVQQEEWVRNEARLGMPGSFSAGEVYIMAVLAYH